MVPDEHRYVFEESMVVTFQSIEGTTELNGRMGKIISAKGTKITIDIDASNFNVYIRGGEILRIEQEAEFSFVSFLIPLSLMLIIPKKSLANSLNNPSICHISSQDNILFLLTRAIGDSLVGYENILNRINELNQSLEQPLDPINDKLLKIILSNIHNNFPPLVSLIEEKILNLVGFLVWRILWARSSESTDTQTYSH